MMHTAHLAIEAAVCIAVGLFIASLLVDAAYSIGVFHRVKAALSSVLQVVLRLKYEKER